MLKAVIFDLDGVLIDSQPIHFDTDKAVLSACGADVTQDDLERYAGMPNTERMAAFKRDFDINESVDELLESHTRILHALLDETPIPAVPGSLELVEKLNKAGVKTAVASSSSRAFVLKALELAFHTNYFDPIVCGEDVLKGKPAPDIFLKAAEISGAAPDECVIFEDTTIGIKAARAAGIRCVAYRNPTSGEQDLSGASAVIDSFFDVDLQI